MSPRRQLGGHGVDNLLALLATCGGVFFYQIKFFTCKLSLSRI